MSTNASAVESSSDAVVSSEPPSNGDIAVSNGAMAVVGAESLDSKTETLTTQPSSGGTVVQDLVDDTRVSGHETGIESSSDAVISSEPPSNGDIAGNKGVMVVVGTDSLDLETETLTTQPSSGGIIVQELVDDARVSGGEIGIVKENSELVQDLVDDARVSGDETGVVMDNNEKSLNESSSDVVVLSEHPAASYEDEIGVDLLESKSGTLIMEASDHDGGGDIVVQKSNDEARVSGDEIETVMENSELVLDKPISDHAVNGIKSGADSLGLKTETLTMKPSANHDEEGDTFVQDSMDDSRVSRDEKGTVMENIEKVSDENEVNNEEKEGEYKVADIIWAKVKNYPWWPGQIFDPSSSNDKAKKYSNKKGFLVGYYGDQTFAWNKASNIKPFRKNFSKLEKQSNSKAFFHAVDCALDEVSRRVEFGLACSCLSKEVYDKIKSQVFVNSGIREEASKIDGGDRFSTVSTFKPVKVVQSVQELAREHFDGFSRLEVLSMRTQLLAFFRWKGYYQFQAQNILDGPDNKLEAESKLPLQDENKVVEDEKSALVGIKVYSSKKRKSDACDRDDSVPRKKERSLKNETQKGNSSVEKSKKNISEKATFEETGNEKSDSLGKKASSKKRKSDVCDSDDLVPPKKERSLTNMIPKGISSVKRSKKGISKKETVEDNVKEENGNKSGDKKSSISTPKKLFRVGDSICRIAKQISESPSILQKESQKSTNDENSATALILKFTNLDSIPSVTKLNEIFNRYGPVRETETEILKKSNCAKVVFEEKSNAETAFSSAGKFSIFGSSLVSYRLDYSPKLKKTNKKDGKSVEEIETEE